MHRLRPSVRTCALTGFLCLASGTQAARVATDARLRHLPLPLPRRTEAPGRQVALPITARSLMAASQLSLLADDRIKTFGTHLGNFETAMIGERLQAPHREGVWDIAGFDRTSGRAFGLGLALPLAAGISLTSEALVTRLKHRLAGVASGAYVRPADRTLIGVGIARRDGPSILFGYETGTLHPGRAEMDRIAALLGGATQGGHGPRLDILNRDDPQPGRVRWGLTLASMQRTLGKDLLAIGATGGAVLHDRRAELSARLAF
jgi:hypothetical protein